MSSKTENVGRDAFVSGRARKQKLGEQIAHKIVDDIIARGWIEGDTLGTERDLRLRYSISRATFREAVRQVERHGAATTRRGVGGGLVVLARPRGAAIRAMMTFLELTRVSFGEQHEVHEQLELTAARLASQRIDDESRSEMLAALEQLEQTSSVVDSVANNMRIRVAIAKATRNPSLPLFIETLNGVLRDILRVLRVEESVFLRDREQSTRFKKELVDTILAGRDKDAERLVRQDVYRRLLAMTTPMTSSRGRRGIANYFEELPDWFESQNIDLKLSERVAFAIVEDIERAGCVEGTNLGNEAALQKKHSVSRAVLREALRQLELHGVVHVKSGVQGGVLIGRPDSTYTEEVVCTYLRTTEIAALHLWETQSTLEVLAVEKLAGTASEPDCTALRNALSYLGQASVEDFLARSMVLHGTIADRTGNRALSLFIRILLRFGIHALPPIDPAKLPWLMRRHDRLVEAICAHDAVEARREITLLFNESRIWVGGHHL
ncbi:FadR family transcriptional regulator [Novosphingobium sp. ERN07]|nr:FadR family transcriptional regulator [Novosphingobium sp. ERN07]